MENIEGLYRKEMQFEVGDRPDNNEQVESYFDEKLDEALDGLRKKECFSVVDSINRLDGNKVATKERLFQALNAQGLGWDNLDSYTADKKAGEVLNSAIVAWAEEVELTHGDVKAIDTAGAALAEKIENL